MHELLVTGTCTGSPQNNVTTPEEEGRSSWERQCCPHQEQHYRISQGQAPCPSAALTLGTVKHFSTLLLIPTKFQAYNVNLFPILKGFLWLKEIYNQVDNSQDSMNL